MPPPPLDPATLWPPGHPRSSSLGHGDDDEIQYHDGDDAQEGAPVVMRSIGVGDARRSSSYAQSYNSNSMHNDIKDDEESSEVTDLFESEPEPITLPESTHTLFFTQPLFSLPQLYALSIVVVSAMCLVMALLNNIVDRSKENPLSVPVNVSKEVRIAQYLSIIIVLVMEEEIPTGLYLLRSINKASFKKKFPGRSYSKFVLAAVLRIAMGYVFLVNVFIILAQANDVIGIFYDVLALQFIQQLDDIAFTLAKWDVLGKRLQRACTAKLFETEFEKQKSKRRRWSSIFLKSVYFVNLCLLIVGMVRVSVKQMNGSYQCEEITVDFGDEVWEDSILVHDSGDLEERLLVFSTFSGVYKRKDKHTHAGRPVYYEARKFDNQPYEDIVVPAEIRYNDDLGAWIFDHPNIRKTMPENSTVDDETPWLLRSRETSEYNLLEVPNEWSLWRGMIQSTKVSYECNACSDKSDCNFNGVCEAGVCQCNKEGEKKSGRHVYIGTHCEVKLKRECGTIISEGNNITFSIILSDQIPGELFTEYNRPVYSHVEGMQGLKQGDINWLVYTGRRWVLIGFNPGDLNMTFDQVYYSTVNYHTFWSPRFSFSSGGLRFISDPTTEGLPVGGLDWYQVGERGSQFGPFGALYPLQKDNQTGRGIFSCAGPTNDEIMLRAMTGYNESVTVNQTLSNGNSRT